MWEHRCRVAAVGIGYSKITRVVEEPLGILAVRAARIAIEDAGLKESDIDGLATYPSLQARGQSEEDGVHIVSCDYMILGLKDAPIRWYSDHRSGFIASPLIEAVNAIIAGACNYAIVWRAMHNPRGPYRTFRSDYALRVCHWGAGTRACLPAISNPLRHEARAHGHLCSELSIERQQKPKRIFLQQTDDF
jgi:hypothetical protein